MAAPPMNNLPDAGGERPSPSAQQVHLQVYHLCILRHLRDLDAEIFKLKMNDSAAPGFVDEIEKIRQAERIYKEFQRNLQQLNDLHNGDGNDNAASPAENRARI